MKLLDRAAVFGALLGAVAPSFAQEPNAQQPNAQQPFEREPDSQQPEWKWNGPFPTTNQRPYVQIFLDQPLQLPDSLEKGHESFETWLDVSNNMLRPNADGSGVEEDFETQRLSLLYRRGLGRDLELGASASLVARNGGFGDSVIENWHTLFGFKGASEDNPIGRDRLPRGRTRLFLEDENGNTIINEGKAFGLGDTQIWIKKQLSEPENSSRNASSLRLALELPTGDDSELLGSGGVDLGLSLDASRRLSNRWLLFGQLELASFGDGDVSRAESWGYGAGIGTEWKFGRRTSFVVQSELSSVRVQTNQPISDRAQIVTSLGLKHRFNGNRTGWISFTENGDWNFYKVPLFGNTGPDFGIALGLEWQR